jgi:hypothetical protein
VESLPERLIELLGVSATRNDRHKEHYRDHATHVFQG